MKLPAPMRGELHGGSAVDHPTGQRNLPTEKEYNIWELFVK
jgi:hypothetical protein